MLSYGGLLSSGGIVIVGEITIAYLCLVFGMLVGVGLFG
jgi:hypothetical protein